MEGQSQKKDYPFGKFNWENLFFKECEKDLIGMRRGERRGPEKRMGPFCSLNFSYLLVGLYKMVWDPSWEGQGQEHLKLRGCIRRLMLVENLAAGES